MQKIPPGRFGPKVGDAVDRLDRLLDKLVLVEHKIGGHDQPGSDEIREAMHMVRSLKTEMETAQPDPETVAKAIRFATAITQLLDNLINMIFYFYWLARDERHPEQRRHHRSASTSLRPLSIPARQGFGLQQAVPV